MKQGLIGFVNDLICPKISKIFKRFAMVYMPQRLRSAVDYLRPRSIKFTNMLYQPSDEQGSYLGQIAVPRRGGKYDILTSSRRGYFTSELGLSEEAAEKHISDFRRSDADEASIKNFYPPAYATPIPLTRWERAKVYATEYRPWRAPYQKFTSNITSQGRLQGRLQPA